MQEILGRGKGEAQEKQEEEEEGEDMPVIVTVRVGFRGSLSGSASGGTCIRVPVLFWISLMVQPCFPMINPTWPFGTLAYTVFPGKHKNTANAIQSNQAKTRKQSELWVTDS
jgi:hypothetical protein